MTASGISPPSRQIAVIIPIVILATIVSITGTAQAQNPCDYGSDSHVLDTEHALIRVSNNGLLFYKRGKSEPFFEAPKGSGIQSIEAVQIRIGGLENGELRLSGGRYEPTYYPGLLDIDGLPVPECGEYDRIFHISRSDFFELNAGEISSGDFVEWPYDQGAPVIDGNNNASDYRLDDGDRPALVGNESAWWVMNDGGIDETHYDIPVVGLETDVYVGALSHGPDFQVLFFRYRFTYKRPVSLEDAYIGILVDPGIGDHGNDAVGADTLLDLGYAYNLVEEDRYFPNRPPAIGVVLLNGPSGTADGKDNDHDGDIDEPDELLGMTSLTHSDDDVHEWHGIQTYNNMKGLCRDGYPIRLESHGPVCNPKATGSPTKYFYSGDPVNSTGSIEWSFGDKKFMMTTGPFDWQPNTIQILEFAVIWARGQDHLDSVSRVKSIAAFIKDNPEFFDPNQNLEFQPPSPVFPSFAAYGPAYPNPADESVSLEYSVTDPTISTIILFDATGRQIKTVLDAFRDPGWYTETIDVSDLPSGVYFYRISIGRLSATKPLTVIH